MGRTVFLVDINRCSGCYNCQLACKDEHCGQDWMPIAEAQPLTGQFWIKVDSKVRGTVPKVKLSYLPHLCNHCENATCIEAGAGAVYRREDGLVIIDPEKARGNRALVDSCPYGAIYWNEDADLAQKCTGCAHLLDDGWTVPRCVDACASKALRFGDEAQFTEEISGATTLLPELDLKPRVYYLNLPKRFVAGEVFDPETDEVLIGAKVTLAKDDEVVATTLTDDFGDFWFHQVEPADYRVFIEQDGYLTRMFEADATEEDVNIGIVEAYRA